MHAQTRAIRAGRADNQNALAPILWATSTFTADTVSEAHDMAIDTHSSRFYTRYGNPTVKAFEDAIADLEGTESARAFASGMGALSAIVLGLCSSGDHIVAQRQLYAGTQLLLQTVCPRFGIGVTFVDGTKPGAFAEAVLPGRTVLVMAETPANPKLAVVDLAAVGAIAGPMTVVDSTFATPLAQRPAEFGVDLVVHSATKAIAGHNDATIGVVAGSEELLGWLWNYAVLHGAVASPFDALNALRGVRTLAVRLRQQTETATALAGALEGHPMVEAVHYPGLAVASPARAGRQADGPARRSGLLRPQRRPRSRPGFRRGGPCRATGHLAGRAGEHRHPSGVDHPCEPAAGGARGGVHRPGDGEVLGRARAHRRRGGRRDRGAGPRPGNRWWRGPVASGVVRLSRAWFAAPLVAVALFVVSAASASAADEGDSPMVVSADQSGSLGLVSTAQSDVEADVEGRSGSALGRPREQRAGGRGCDRAVVDRRGHDGDAGDLPVAHEPAPPAAAGPPPLDAVCTTQRAKSPRTGLRRRGPLRRDLLRRGLRRRGPLRRDLRRRGLRRRGLRRRDLRRRGLPRKRPSRPRTNRGSVRSRLWACPTVST